MCYFHIFVQRLSLFWFLPVQRVDQVLQMAVWRVGLINGVKALQSWNKWGCIFRIIPGVAALSPLCVGLPDMQSWTLKRFFLPVKGFIWWTIADKALTLLRGKRLAFHAFIGRPVICKCHEENGDCTPLYQTDSKWCLRGGEEMSRNPIWRVRVAVTKGESGAN